jgi:DNA-binding MarR family transcriptional regulator
MEDSSYSRSPSEAFYRAEAEQQAKLLSHPKRGHYIHPFLGQERSISTAAELLGCSLQTMHYRVKQLVKAGLLRVTREEQRAGRAVRYYRAVSDAFFIPDALTEHADLEERLLADFRPTLSRIAKGIAEGVRREGRTGQCRYLNEQGSVSSYGCVESSDGTLEFNREYPFRRPNTDRRGDIYLTDEEARELAQELGALFDRYLQNTPEGRKEFTFIYALVLSPHE